jgi:cell division protease FtsH
MTTGLLLLLVVLCGAMAWGLSYLAPASDGPELSLDQLQALIAEGQVVEVELRDEDAQLAGTYRGESGTESFVVAYPKSDAATGQLLRDLAGSGARITVDAQAGKAAVRLLVTVLLPLILLADLFALFLSSSRGGSSGIGEVTTFGQVGDRKHRAGQQAAIGFADVAGIDDVVGELREVVDYLRDPTRYREVGAAAPKGVLLFGPPGVGKTLVAKAVAGEAGVPFFSVAGAEFVESLVGVGAARVRDLFRRVRAVAPAIVFIDELDAAGRRRGSSSGGGSDEREQTLNQLLVEMDGFDAGAGIVVMAATNRPDILDPALLRPGRFDRHLVLEKPDVQARAEILAVHAAKRRVAEDIDLPELARRTPGFSGADLANVVNEAALLAVREGSGVVSRTHLREAVDRVAGGPRRRAHLLTPAERRRVAVHEAGHAVAAVTLGFSEELQRVSVVARNRGAGSIVVGADDAQLRTAAQLKARLTVELAGDVAEEVLVGDGSTAGEDDLERGTALARAMVGRFAMTPAIRQRVLAAAADVHLGGRHDVGDVSEGLRVRFDLAVEESLAEAREEATRIVTEHRVTVEQLAGALEQHESLEGEALHAHLRQAASLQTP